MIYRLVSTAAWIVGVALVLWRTDGLEAASTQGKLRLSLEQAAIPLEDWPLQDDNGHDTSLHQISGTNTVLVNFVYTRCPSFCTAQGFVYATMQNALRTAGRSDVKLLSLSIDPANDPPLQLRRYRERHGGDDTVWRLARPAPGALSTIQKQTGLRIIDDGMDGYAHSTDLYVVKEGRLVDMLDWQSPNLLADLP